MFFIFLKYRKKSGTGEVSFGLNHKLSTCITKKIGDITVSHIKQV